MAETKTASKTPAVKDETPVATVENTPEDFTIDTKELSHTLKVIRYRAQELLRDAARKTPILARSQEEARAKATAFVKVLKEFSEKTA